MNLVTWNIHYGVGRDGRCDLDRVARTVAGADLIGLNEVERHWPRSGMIDQPAAIARRLPDYHWVYGAYLDLDASERTADGSVTNRRRQHGNMLLSRWPILVRRNHVLPKVWGLNHFAMPGGAIEGIVHPPGVMPMRVYSVHLGSLGTEERKAQIDALLESRERAMREGGAWTGAAYGGGGVDWSCGEAPPPNPYAAIVMGDFNAAADAPEVRAMIAATPGVKGEVRVRRGFTDAFAARGEGHGATYVPDGGGEGVRIDYCFVANEIAGSVVRARVDRDADGSDHQPLWVEVDLDAQALQPDRGSGDEERSS